MEVRELAKDFVVSSLGVRQGFFDTAWDFISQNYDRLASARLSDDDFRQLCKPLGIIGREQQGALLAVLIFVDAVKQVPVTGNTEELIAAIQTAGKKYDAHTRLTEDILREVRGSLQQDRARGPERVQSSSQVSASPYRVWCNDTAPEGKPLGENEKEQIVKEARRYDVLIVREETKTQVFANGKPCKAPPGKLAYRILSYVLRNKGRGGTAWNIAKRVFTREEVERFGDPKEIARAIELQPDLDKARRQETAWNMKKDVKQFSRNVTRRIADLNGYFKNIGLRTTLTAEQNELDEYELLPVPNYYLIEKV